MARKRPRSGFTLIELMITLALFAVLVTVAVPSFQDYILQNRVKTGSQALFTALLYARSEAVKRNDDVHIYPNGGNWDNGWAVTIELNNTDCQSDQANCLQVQQPLSGITIAGGPASVTYGGNGRVASAATFEFCDSEGSAAVGKREVSTDLTGRPHIEYAGDCS